MRKRYPFVKQRDFKDCGCAALSMIIKYYGGYISLDILSEYTKTDKGGTSAYHMVTAANEIGFCAKGIKCCFDDILECNVILPCIAHVVINSSYKHYIVIYKIDYKNKILIIADPSEGVKKISFDYFNEIWTSVLITMYPVKVIGVQKRASILSFILSLLSKNKKYIIYLIILSIFLTIFSISSSFYFKYMIDSISFSRFYLFIIFMIFLYLNLLRVFTDFFRNKLLIFINGRFDYFLTQDTFSKIISLPYRFYHNHTSGEIINRIGDLKIVREMISNVSLSVFIDLPLSIISGIVLFSINSYLFLGSFILLLLYVLLQYIFSNSFNKKIKKIQNMDEEISTYLYESVSGFETIKGININNKIINRFEGKYSKFLNCFLKFQNHINKHSLFKNLIETVGNLIIIFMGFLFVFDNKMSVGGLMAFNSLLIYFLGPITNFVDMDYSIRESREAIERVLDLQVLPDKLNKSNSFINGDIVCNNLSFSMNDRDIILDNINITIKHGEHVVICGNSGSGKSTLMKLFMKYYDVDRGMININNIDINDYSYATISDNFAYISQNEILFSDTVLNNLNLFDYNDDNDIMDVIKTCEFDGMLDNNLGLNMIVEENGFNFSGGQRQRIVLARTLLKKSSVLLIDEGLSQLDVKLERRILKRIFERYPDKTIIIITHRMDNLDLYDRFIELSHGKIVADKQY